MRATYRLSLEELADRGAAPALIDRAGTVTYADFAARAASVGAELCSVGVGAGDPVGLVSVGRGRDEPIALGGMLDAGAVVVPLDATAPPQRLATILAGRGANSIVCDEAATALVDAVDGLRRADGQPPLDRVVLTGEGRIAAAAPALGEIGTATGRHSALRHTDFSTACVLHTSGSTGTPKAIPITWAGIDAFTAFMIDLIGLGTEDRVLRVAELVFDLAWFDHVATLRSGAALVLLPRRDLAAGRATLDAWTALRPTVVYGVPSLFMKVRAALPPGGRLDPAPRAIFTAGEVFPPRELRAFSDALPEGTQLWNLYGPTETNVCTYHPIDRAALDGESEIPIGRPCHYAECTLLADDGAGAVLEGPGIGELVVAGPTAVGAEPHATRDRVERDGAGQLWFRGRIDRMVKIRGYRVEPGEVETALLARPGVRHAAVVVRDDARLGKVLRAFVVHEGGPSAHDDRAIRAQLAEKLPAYMVPERVAALEALPTTTTGKIDYGALAELANA